MDKEVELNRTKTIQQQKQQKRRAKEQKNNMNEYKEKIIKHKEALEMVLKQGKEIEQKSNGKNPNLDGKTFFHEHNVVLIQVPEAPNEEDLKILQEQFPGEKVRTKEIIEQYVVQDNKEYLVKLQYNQREYTDFNTKKGIPILEERGSLNDTLNYDKLDEINRKAKQELISKLALEIANSSQVIGQEIEVDKKSLTVTELLTNKPLFFLLETDTKNMKCARCFQPLKEEVFNHLKAVVEDVKKELIHWGLISSNLKKLE
ncbi:7688_t:CDS:2, partial [Scutellospora calospora]